MIGNVCGIVASMDEATVIFHQRMNDLNVYMKEYKIPPDLRFRLREYFHHCRILERAKHYNQLLQARINCFMPPAQVRRRKCLGLVLLTIGNPCV